MSLVLGHIHHWLYNQIKVVEEREIEIINAFKEKYESSEIEEIVESIREEYGNLKGETPLEELIGDSHIHPWLEGAISVAQTREAAIVKALMDQYNDKELLVEVYRNNGAELANASLNELDSNDLRAAFELLKNTLVERMPCDRLSAVVRNETDKIIWRHNGQLHTEFWKAAGVSIELMHELYSIWIATFVAAINSDINHERELLDGQYEDIFTL
ncbi:hypothetical protein [Orenia marismortui]|uniref:hypothetical protein n=1 Tax=Orenia marismortui TaxID=46469 RepID=UPI0003701201|nr:hypothetical protein [Orenia marismortui]